MAAQDYYGIAGARPPSGPAAGPRPMQQRYQPSMAPQGSPNPPYPMSDAPPPYSSASPPRTHSQPPPQRYGRPSSSAGPSPATANPYQGQGYQYPPEKWPDQYQHQQQQHQQQQQYAAVVYPPPQSGRTKQNSVHFSPAPAVRPPNQRTNTPNYPAPSPSPYRRNSYSPSRSRSRSRDRRERHHHYDQSRSKPREKKKGSGVDTFLGAGGGAIIGDAIFPGLGTIGGALLGGYGGHEYGKKRARSHDTRMRTTPNDHEYGYDDDYRRGRRY